MCVYVCVYVYVCVCMCTRKNYNIRKSNLMYTIMISHLVEMFQSVRLGLKIETFMRLVSHKKRNN